ncbi:keratin-associated protein 6-2-like [Diorhabda sublineata]|uniref:keratin-associated protein 6-2-like n=1 Tax=Diorhabda sublineata TaxID=1163346 RepID=UPI0024E0E171|nr:keratin-associated protein 6-2-like [Diorhabda sublineata]
MFRFLVVCVAVTMASAAPGIGYGGYGSYGGYGGYGSYGGYGGYGVIPAATSYSSRIDHHTPILKTAVVAPVVSKAYVSPISYHSSPIVSSYGLGHGYGAGLGYGSGYGYGLGHGYDLGHGYGLGNGYNLGYGHGW